MKDRVHRYPLFVRDPVTNEPLGPMPVASTCAADDEEPCDHCHFSDVKEATFNGGLTLTAKTEWILFLILLWNWDQDISEDGGTL